MKKFLPFLTIGFVVLGGCGLEKPPATLEFPGEHEGAANEAVEAAAPEAPLDPALAAGKAVYDMSCGACHDAGMMGAPKPGDKAAWADRVAQGLDVMTQKSIDGFTGAAGMMPAKGGNMDLTDEEVGGAVAWMASTVE
ncbi:cytochrome c5 family protein [Chlorobium phaeovibrioides]|uniref:C-type cytochrome n=1 Tax=Chlorobium phaeovibrioides TaxID=1094 RepID=A0A432AT78_CHLPH|nr:c-type cytochrome [Chlorobium phaeovibrioides]KAA6231871.1 cytochrome c5 family protein [Chlorobium phaeovibrioides]MWV53488.1 c-type cytochrome [Chlorobium phaeovibrioides]QEQ57572.1 cytochrome c5 family protein [Chlorobium phaeovibrioides]RTY36206.1 cytochrome c5 family protein [Chlorobium phaeovibrioides]RTY36256.1 cytochrome c5 family protein [Chlorobium phaeovibrioides]